MESTSMVIFGSAGFTVLSYYISGPLRYAGIRLYPATQSGKYVGVLVHSFAQLHWSRYHYGLPTTVSMTAGAIVGWAVLSPLAYYRGWAPGHPLDSEDGGKGWILWISLAIMCSESVVGLVALVASNGIRDLKSLAAKKKARFNSNTDSASPLAEGIVDEDEDHEPPHRQTPKTWVTIGLILSTLTAILLIYVTFGYDAISPWATLLGIILASLFAILGVRALGETDLNPVSGIGKISQLIFALIQPNNVLANLIAGGISEAGAMQAGDLMQDYKTGHSSAPPLDRSSKANSSAVRWGSWSVVRRTSCIPKRMRFRDRSSRAYRSGVVEFGEVGESWPFAGEGGCVYDRVRGGVCGDGVVKTLARSKACVNKKKEAMGMKEEVVQQQRSQSSCQADSVCCRNAEYPQLFSC